MTITRTATENYYQATFSNGQTVTRSSYRVYTHAAGYMNKETGELWGVVFSATPAPKETRSVYQTISRHGMGYRERQQAEEFNRQEAKIWTWEIVSVETQIATSQSAALA